MTASQFDLDATLRCMYALPTSAPCTSQDDASVAVLTNILREFVMQQASAGSKDSTGSGAGSQDAKVPCLWPDLNPADAACLQYAVGVMHAGNSAGSNNRPLPNQGDVRIAWLPGYGCVLLAVGQLPVAAAAQHKDAPTAGSTLPASSPSAPTHHDTRPWLGELAVHVVGLDGWTFNPHR